MKKLLFVLAVALTFSTMASAIEIAISTKSGWWGQAAADQEMQDIVNRVKSVPVKVFTINDLDALANWVRAHTGDGAPDLLIMCGNFPETIYPSGNAQPEGSLAERFLDDGNTIINTGDYIFYVGTTANNDAGGLQNMMDVPGAAMWGDDSLATIFVPTADGKLYTPSLPATPSNRPWFPAQFNGTNWYVELILAQNSDGTQVHPAILRNSVTGGRLGVFFQVADQFTDIRGEVISEWINNWYLPHVSPPMVSANPSPADKAVDVPRDTVLGWKASAYAGAHDVYLGTTFADVNSASRTAAKGVLASQGQADVTFDPPGSLAYGQTYYWRVDEVNATADSTIHKGSVWSFTVEPYGYPLTKVTATASTSQPSMGPEKTINGSGLTGDQHDIAATTMWMSTGVPPNWIQYQFDAVYKLDKMLVWNSNQAIETYIGFGAKDVTVEYSVDGSTWTALPGVPQFARATGLATYTANTTVNFGGMSAKFVKLTINQTWGGLPTTGLSEVRFSYVPLQARAPQPATGATGQAITTTLNWRPGREAGSHKVFFATDSNAVTNGTADAKTVADHAFDPGILAYATTYYWRVDEVNTVTTPGSVWSFTTAAYGVVDDFESYNDTSNCIYDTWVDGVTDGKSGSQVGWDASPFAEQKIIHGGSQSMPLRYDNTAKFSFSEATRTFATAQNWTASGIKSLSLYFQGAAGNTGQLYLKINGTKVAYNGAAGDLAKGAWTPWNIDLSTTGATLNKVTSLTIGIEGSGKGTVYVDDIRLYPKTPQYVTPVDPGKTNLVGLWTLDGDAKDSSGKGNNGTVNGTATWVNGMINKALQFNGTSTYVDCGNGASLKATDGVTITAWIKMDFTAGDRKIAGNQDNTTGGYKLGVYSNNFVEFEIRTSGNVSRLTRNATSGGTALQQGVWYHVAGTYVKGASGQTLRTYVFGNVDRELGTSQILGSSTGTFKLGKEPFADNGYWLGALDDVQVYNKALSQEEILWVMGQTTPVAKPF